MTIALGLIASDGFLVAADTEVAHGYMKSEATKIDAVYSVDSSSDPWRAAPYYIAGADSEHHAAVVKQELTKYALGAENKSAEDIEAAFRQILARYHSEHVVPFAQFPDHARPSFKILIAARLPKAKLLVSEQSSFREERKYAVIGSGEQLADQYLLRFSGHPFDTPSAVIAAAYVMFLAKEFAQGCGKTTEILGIWNEREFQISLDETKALDDAFYDYAYIQEPSDILALAGEEPTHTTKARERIAELATQIRERLRRI